MTLTVPVELGAGAYEIRIGAGLLAEAGDMLAGLLARPFTVIVTDRSVAELHLAALENAFAGSGIATKAIVLAPGEATKSFAELERLVDRLLALDVERRDIIVAFGGGVIGDLAGFAASVLRRGIDYIQVPTTLLAQVDSSVGGKTAINTPRGKNLIGAFHQPRLVLADVELLASLPRRALLGGYAEVVKYGLLGDAGFFDWLERHGPAVIAGDGAARIEAVANSCRAKARIVAADEREENGRALLNLGHTFGHALEAEAGLGERLSHGEAVAIGMVMAFELSSMLGLCPPADTARVRRHLAAIGLPTSTVAAGLGRLSADRLIDHMRQDKKVRDGKPTFILVRGIGAAFVSRAVSTAEVRAVLEQELTAKPAPDRGQAT